MIFVKKKAPIFCWRFLFCFHIAAKGAIIEIKAANCKRKKVIAMDKNKNKTMLTLALCLGVLGILIYAGEVAYAFLRDRNKDMDYTFDDFEDDDIGPEEAEAIYKNEE